jgi:hypothetical protein
MTNPTRKTVGFCKINQYLILLIVFSGWVLRNDDGAGDEQKTASFMGKLP